MILGCDLISQRKTFDVEMLGNSHRPESPGGSDEMLTRILPHDPPAGVLVITFWYNFSRKEFGVSSAGCRMARCGEKEMGVSPWCRWREPLPNPYKRNEMDFLRTSSKIKSGNTEWRDWTHSVPSSLNVAEHFWTRSGLSDASPFLLLGDEFLYNLHIAFQVRVSTRLLTFQERSVSLLGSNCVPCIERFISFLFKEMFSVLHFKFFFYFLPS